MENQPELKNYTIYKIICKDPLIKDCYVGKTTNLKKRKALHKCRCNNINSDYYNLKVYQFIRQNGNWNNWLIVNINTYEQITEKKASEKERLHYNDLNATLNKQVPNQTQKESKAKYYQNNTEKIKLINGQVKLCKCGQTYTHNHKLRHEKSERHIKLCLTININK